MISIIIVNYVNYDDTIECVKSIVKSKTTEDYRIIIVDNASPNDSWDRLQCLNVHGTVILIQSPANNGYCAGNNVGIKYSIDNLNPDYIWILNPDTLVEPCTLQNLYEYSQRQTNLGILGCKLVYYPDTQYLQAFGGSNYSKSPLGDLRPEQHVCRMASSDTPLPKDICLDLIVGASMFIPTSVFNKVGLMNESYFLYSDESEFCLMVIRAGFRNIAISDAVVYHKEGYRKKTQSLLAEYYTSRNALYMVSELFPHNLKRNIQVFFVKTLYRLCTLRFRKFWYRIKAYKDFKNNVRGKVL